MIKVVFVHNQSNMSDTVVIVEEKVAIEIQHDFRRIVRDASFANMLEFHAINSFVQISGNSIQEISYTNVLEE